MVRKPPHQPALHSPCPAANSPGNPARQPTQSQVQKSFSDLEPRTVEVFCPHLAGRRGKKSSLMAAVGCPILDASGGAEKPGQEMLNFSPGSIPHGCCCILTTYFPALKPKPGVSKHHNLHVLQDGRKSLPLALLLDMWVKAAVGEVCPPTANSKKRLPNSN